MNNSVDFNSICSHFCEFRLLFANNGMNLIMALHKDYGAALHCKWVIHIYLIQFGMQIKMEVKLGVVGVLLTDSDAL